MLKKPPEPHQRGVRSKKELAKELAGHANQRGGCKAYVDSLH